MNCLLIANLKNLKKKKNIKLSINQFYYNDKTLTNDIDQINDIFLERRYM